MGYLVGKHRYLDLVYGLGKLMLLTFTAGDNDHDDCDNKRNENTIKY